MNDQYGMVCLKTAMDYSSLSLERPVSLKPLNEGSLGFSLLEVMMIVALMSLTILPMTITINQLATQARGVYVASSRNLQVNSLIDSMDAARPDFATQFTDGAMVTTQSESAQTLPYWRKVDVTNAGNTTSLKRTTALYTYNNTTDTSSAPREKLEAVSSTDSLRLRFGNATPIIDSSGNYWYGDGGATPLLYSSTNEVPGAETSYSIPGTSSDIVNTNGNDDEIYFNGRAFNNGANSPIVIKADVPNGWYIVKVYMTEHNTGVLINQRNLDFFLQGVRLNQRRYDVLSVTGGYHRGNVQMFETYVSNGVLTFEVQSVNTSFIRSISIMKKKG